MAEVVLRIDFDGDGTFEKTMTAGGTLECLEGACCLDDGTCSVVTEAECFATGGSWNGPASTCDPSPCCEPIRDWVYNPATNHYYRLTDRCYYGTVDGGAGCPDSSGIYDKSCYRPTWIEAEAEAQAISPDAHLVTVNDQAENDWIVATFGGDQEFWIGFTDHSLFSSINHVCCTGPGWWNDMGNDPGFYPHHPDLPLRAIIESPSPVNPTAGGALQFDGTDFALVPHDASLSFDDQSSATIEMWLMVTETPAVFHLLGKRIACAGGPDANYQIARDENLGFHAGLGCGTPLGSGGPIDLPQNEWHHVALTSTPSECKIYLDGIPMNSVPRGPETYPNTAALRIGTSGGCVGMRGLVDEVRIWNIARTPEEISSNYACQVSPQSAGLVGYWRFDEDVSSQYVLDSSSEGNDGTLGSSDSPGTDDPVRVASGAPLTCGLTGVPQTPESIPDFLLHAPRPNPSTGHTELRFALQPGGHAQLHIYDVTGSLVRRVVDGWLDPGEHMFVWDGRREDGRQVSAGVYLARLVSKERTESRKFVRLR
jgi:hypothetical protein